MSMACKGTPLLIFKKRNIDEWFGLWLKRLETALDLDTCVLILAQKALKDAGVLSGRWILSVQQIINQHASVEQKMSSFGILGP